jgi:uncharacterized protein (TIGR00369 family)
MSEQSTGAVSPPPPEGFVRCRRRSPLTDPWEPIFERPGKDGIARGLWLREAHCNARGFAHGGLISALADNTMGHSCVAALGGGVGLVTVNLSVDFLGAAKPGAWLQVDGVVVKTGRSLSFAECKVTADGKLCARGTASFMAV